MIKQLKTLALAIGLVAGLSLASTSFAAKPKEAAPAAPAATAPAPAPEAAAPAAAPAAAVATPAAAPSAHEENPYGLSALWAQGDIVAKGTLLILVLMSMGSWYVIITKFLEQSKAAKFAKAAPKTRSGLRLLCAKAQTAWQKTVLSVSLQKRGLRAPTKHTGLLGAVDFNTWSTQSIQRAIGNVQSRMQDGLAVLATVGSTSPFVGLFGTVWGIYNALVKIGMSGQASIDKVAGPVGESLIMTAIGLAVAVPAVLGYNWLVRRNKAIMEDVNAFGSDLHSVLLASSNK